MLIEVVGAVIIKDNKVLAARRPLHKNLGGYWEFPGGKVKDGEVPQEALIREIKEELNCTIVVEDFIVRSIYKYDFGEIALSTYYCYISEGTIRAFEHSEIRWLSFQDLESVEWTPADYPTLNIIKLL